MDFQKCSLETSDAVIVVCENRSKFQVQNPDKRVLSKVKVDGCLIADGRERCDWIVACNDIGKAMFIELKGCNLDKAISQLESTLRHTNEVYLKHKKECYAVTTRVPKHGSSIRRRCIDFYSKNSATLSVKNVLTTVNI